MTKQEIYDELKSDGAKLRAINFISEESLRKSYFDRFGRNPDEYDEHEEPNTGKLSQGDIVSETVSCNNTFPALKFTESGWCSELNRSYFIGIYRPKNKLEYNVLKKYSSEEL